MRGRCHVPSTATVKALCKQLVTVGEAITAHKRASRCHTVDGKCHSCKALQARVPREPAGSIGRRAWASARGRTAAGQQQSDRHQLRATQIPGTEMRAVRGGGGGGGVPRPGVTAGRGSGHSSPLHSSLSWPGDGGGVQLWLDGGRSCMRAQSKAWASRGRESRDPRSISRAHVRNHQRRQRK